jgi:hypothetical protein
LKTIELIRPIRLNIYSVEANPYTEIISSNFTIKIAALNNGDREPRIKVEFYEDDILRRQEIVGISDTINIEINKNVHIHRGVDQNRGLVFSL